MSLITITHRYGTAGLEVAIKVAEGSNWELFDDRKIQELIQERGVSHAAFECHCWSAGTIGRRPSCYEYLKKPS